MNNIEIFKSWLSGNIASFNHKPTIIEDKSNYIILRFEGIIDNISCCISDHFIDIWYQHTEDCSAILIEIDMPSIKTSNGCFICDECKEPDYFKDINELYVEHSFKHLLAWVKNIKTGDTIRALDGSEYGFFSAEINQVNENWTYKDLNPEFIKVLKAQNFRD